MPITDARLTDFLAVIPAARRYPEGFSTTYGAEADVVYINFKKLAQATDSELRDDDIIVGYDGDESSHHYTRRKRAISAGEPRRI